MIGVDLVPERNKLARRHGAEIVEWSADADPALEIMDHPLGTEGFATHRIGLEEAPAGYELFQKKEDGAIKVVLTP